MRNILITCFLLAALIAHAQSPPVPSEKELKSLTVESLRAFQKAIQAKDFTAFHRQTSALWREQITPAKLKSIFQTFIDQEIDLAPILKLDPEFDGPAAIEDEVLVIQGRYPTRPSAVQFRLKYVNEKSAWKLVGIKVDVKGPTVPSEREARALALESLLAFNRAVQAKNFTTFHKQVADVWRKQITPEELKKAFASFTEQEVDIGLIAEHQPVFEPAPGFDEDELLLLKGYYPTEPNKVHFKLRYIQESDAWQLVNIAVNVSPEADADADNAQAATED
ncbi:MAG: hypothetical protein AVDCRST_MAG42-3000 [uncultured Chthoniobacterales bacterium]|uniref:DUF3828 domain-containing protein n=1 Tax=uncultured Chthoniobacterales bacterium TaxID=1836801 RepID=A0A6J4ITF3_9BACT|nr:MAG: hypothetical protein AVDCRST_MAG42-3000 [uncultured Chthoniobacterales bacterium]